MFFTDRTSLLLTLHTLRWTFRGFINERF